jgi:virulence factor Mce-like protein
MTRASVVVPRVIVPAIVAVAAVTVLLVILTSGGSSYTVYADLQDAGGLLTHSTVKVAGIPAGTVSDIKITKGYTAVATLSLDSSAAPIGAGATIQVRPTDLLGEHYAALDPGDLRRPLPSGSTIPLAQTSEPVELDNVLNMLDPGTRSRLRILINEAGVGLLGRGADLNKLLSTMPPTLGQANAMLAQVASENTALRHLIAQGNDVTAAINGHHDQLAQLVSQASGALGVVAAQRAQLGATIANAPSGLTALTNTLDRLNSASSSLRPAAADIQRLATPLATTLQALPSFANSAQSTLAEATNVAPALVRLGQQATAPVARLRPTSQSLTSVLFQAVRPLKEVDFRAMKDLLWFVQNWALGLKARDVLGHVVGTKLSLDPSILISTLATVTGANTPTVLGLARRDKAHSAPQASTPSTAPGPSSSSTSGSSAPARSVVGRVVGTVTKTLVGALQGLGLGDKVSSTVSGLLGAVKLPGSTPPSGTGPSPQGGASSGGSLQQLLKFLIGP